MPNAALTVIDAWVPAAPPGVKTFAAYLTLHNTTTEARSVVAVVSPQFGKTEIHTFKVRDGVAMMHHLAQVGVGSGNKLKFAPKGLHIMLMQPKDIPIVGDVIDITISFDNGSTLAVKAPVRKRQTMEMPHKHGHDHGHGS